MKILVAVDGSACGIRAARYVCKTFGKRDAKAQVTLINVAPALPAGLARLLGAEEVKQYHEEYGTQALRKAHGEFTRSRMTCKQVVVVGPPADALVAFAQKGRFQLIVMGSHGYGALKGLLLGSVVTRVLSQASAPVLVVR